MKKMFIFLTGMMLSISLQAQPETQIFENRWAGGICCASGVEYTFAIRFPEGTFTCFDSLQVDFDGQKFLFSDMQLTRTNGADLSVGFTVSFGYRSDERGFDIDGLTYYHGISAGQIQPGSLEKPQFTLIRRGKEEVVTNVSVERTITAYP
ncbi:MAG TPA: hypothetical protein VK151_00610 [Fluviicola sp.]|nr:hypothetical protein [Fluviicola sp.]